jgi:hypothetical protein
MFIIVYTDHKMKLEPFVAYKSSILRMGRQRNRSAISRVMVYQEVCRKNAD